MVAPTQFRVQAVYHDGMLNLLEPIDLPEGAQVQLDVHLPSSAPARSEIGVHPNQFISARRLDALTSVVAVGGDALADSEVL